MEAVLYWDEESSRKTRETLGFGENEERTKWKQCYTGMKKAAGKQGKPWGLGKRRKNEMEAVLYWDEESSRKTRETLGFGENEERTLSTK